MTHRFNLPAARSAGGLLTTLASTRLEVPGRTEGRTTEQIERWTLCRLLATLTAMDRLTFPLTITHGDKPDFFLEFDGHSIGIEITEAISTDYSKCLALAEREKPDAIIDRSLFRWGAEPKSNRELREIIHSTDFEGDGWAGESAEIEWSRYIESIVAVKSKKLGSYVRHDEQWLAVYDNLPLPSVHLARAAEKLQSLLNPWYERVRFDALFVEHGPVILEMTAHSISFHQLNDLW